MTNDEEIRMVGEAARGERAKVLLGNQVYKDAFTAVEGAILEKWKTSPIRDHEGQSQLRLMHHLLAQVRKYIEEVAQTGKMAEITLANERTVKARRKAA